MSLCYSSSVSRVYPRVCGGTLCQANDPAPAQGLSPRVRGNHAKAEAVGSLIRSIPACAGEPRLLSAGQKAPRVYPRVCGGTTAAAV